MIIRDERPADRAAIHAVTHAAFATMPYSEGDEAELIDALRAAGALKVSLVAESAGEIAGHIGFSPVTIAAAQGVWFGLAPVSVRPDRQREGIGSALIRAGLARIEALGAAGCVLLGHTGYYPRFGFAPDSALTYKGKPHPALQRLTMQGGDPAGEVVFHPAFG